MVEVVVVSVREFFMTCFLSANGLDVKKGDKVIFQNDNGTFCGTVIKDKYLEKEENLEFVTLEVRASNAPAIALYESFGFELVGARKKYYENKEDAILYNFKVEK